MTVGAGYDGYEHHEANGRSDMAWRGVLRSVEGGIGFVLGAIMLAVIGVGRFVAPYSPLETAVGPPAVGPSTAHLFGTDLLGRDVLSRVLTGGDFILLIAVAGVSLSYLGGGSLGMIGAYVGGAADTIVVRVFDALMTLPALLMLFVLVGALGTSRLVLVLAIALIFTAPAGRMMRGTAQAIVTRDYVTAARARGERTIPILAREVLPNMIAPAVADYGLRLTYGIITVATMSFLGLGAQPPAPDWGAMVSEARGIVTVQPVAILGPVAAIAALSISLNLIAESFARHLSRDTAVESLII